MEEDNKIVVFQAFDTIIQANLVKTKLDAYGIPCFLSDENFVSLYPIRNEIFPGIRLHIFETDIERVSEILSENISFDREGALKCPKCKSTKIELDNKGAGIWRWITTALLQIIAPQKRIFKCHACGNEFNYTDT